MGSNGQRWGWRLERGAVVTALLALALAGCKSKAGDTCRAGTAECLDRATELACQSGNYVAAPCRGPAGCVEKGSVVSCDVSANTAGDVCSTDDENKGSCSADQKTQIVCRSGKYEVHPCRGPTGCKPTTTGSDCDVSVAEENDPCTTAGDACSVDRSALFSCRGGKFVLSSHCRGPDACKDAGDDKLVCDTSLAAEGDPCSVKGGACGVDRKSLLECKDGKFALDTRCRGANGCSAQDGDRLSCDMSISEVGDPCESGAACSIDSKSLLSCKDGKFVVTVPCARGCRVNGESVGCGG